MNRFLKRSLATVIGSPAVRPLSGWLERAAAECGGLCVLTWHRIGSPEQALGDPDLFSARSATFARQVEILRRHYQPVSIGDVLAAQAGGPPLPSRAVLLTFDDAYHDFADNAWPILRRAGVPVTLFVPTGFPGTDRAFWWDRLAHAFRHASNHGPITGPWGSVNLARRAPRVRYRTLRRLKDYLKSVPHEEAMACVEDISCRLRPTTEPESEVLNWDELRELARQGVSIGLHTQNHPLLNRIDEKQMRVEIVQAWAELRQQIPAAVPALAYPAGAEADSARALLGEAGIQLAFTTRAGWNAMPANDPFRLRRIHVGLTTSVDLFRFRLASCFATAARRQRAGWERKLATS